MDVVIAGAHGQVARQLARMLAGRGDRVRGLVRNPDHTGDLRADGAEPVVCNLEETTPEQLAGTVAGADAVVFAAGAGPGSGAARKETVDHGAAVKLLDAARLAGVRRYVMVSAMGTDHPPQDDAVFSVYLRAKARADQALAGSDLEWTIVRPGRLTDDPPTGRVELARHVARGSVPRADVAAVLLAVLDDDRTTGHIMEVVGGTTPIEDGLRALTG
jgi:uncharacterized protein YbjT (DUF2867 family)